jgi:oligopeptide/dipeptide ABC transporter ATP-binding protein
MSLLEVKGLTKYFDLNPGWVGRMLYGERVLRAVDQINFSIEEGKVFGLVGESGCGKSTTARLITRLVPATGGEVYFAGQNVFRLPKKQVREMRKHIQMVFQDPFASLNPRMRIVDIVGRPLNLYFGVTGEKRARQVAELLELVGLQPDHIYRYPHEFSGGQRQRIGIARALATRPKMIIADEPVSSLDVSVQAQILNLFKKLQRELNLTILFISHDLNVVEYMADMVAVMYAGKIVEAAQTQELFQHRLHPYTKGLIASNPSINPNATTKKPEILKGEVALPINPAPGCRFESRCPIRVDKCKTVEPLLDAKRANHLAACHEI